MAKKPRSRLLTWLLGNPSHSGQSIEPPPTALTSGDSSPIEVGTESVPIGASDGGKLLQDASEPTPGTLPDSERALQRLSQRLRQTKQALGAHLFGLFQRRVVDRELLDNLEAQLLVSDVGLPTTTAIMQQLEQAFKSGQLPDSQALHAHLKQLLKQLLQPIECPLTFAADSSPYVVLMVGVNGVGKTTTLGKLAYQLKREGHSVMLAAGDTFRAAAVEQLQIWGERHQIPVISQPSGADAAAVAFDALQAAKARKIDILLIDTAGRLHNKEHLMASLQKMVRVIKKVDERAPQEILLTLDATTGQNALSQVKLFNEAVGITGLVLSKLEGTAKGGVVLALAEQFGIPIRYIGLGEQADDLRPFVSNDFIEALLTPEEALEGVP
jgi:fused signal recognition particle receptor